MPSIDVRACTLPASGRLNSIPTDLFILSQARDASIEFTPRMWKGIWDTGDSKSCINKDIVNHLHLIPVGKIQISTAGGLVDTSTYLVDIGLPNGVLVRDVLVSCADLGRNLDVLIGMDIITLGDFAITNVNGRTTFSFRIPSIATIDFTNEKNPYIKVL